MSTIVGIFHDGADAAGAIDRIDTLGVDEGRIHVLTRRGTEAGRESLFGALARAFRGGGDAIGGDLIRLGLDREEAEFYDEELDEEGLLLAVEADDDQEAEVLAIMSEANATLRET